MLGALGFGSFVGLEDPAPEHNLHHVTSFTCRPLGKTIQGFSFPCGGQSENRALQSACNECEVRQKDGILSCQMNPPQAPEKNSFCPSCCAVVDYDKVIGVNPEYTPDLVEVWNIHKTVEYMEPMGFWADVWSKI